MTAQIQRLYKDMTPRQLAVVSVNAELAGDETTPREILAYIPRKNYTMSDAAYGDTAQYLMGMVIALMADYYQSHASYASVMVEVMRKTHRPGTIDTDDNVIAANAVTLERMVDRAHYWRTRRDMIDHFCSVVCEESGLDEAIVRKRAGLPDDGPENHPECLSDELKRELDEMLSGWRESFSRCAA